MNKTRRIVIRCSEETYREFRRLATEFRNYEECLKALIETFKKYGYTYGYTYELR
jgi:hypothetical protein